MRRTRSIPTFVAFCAFFCPAFIAVQAVELSLYCNPTQMSALKAVISDWERDTGNTVVFHAASDSSSEALTAYQKLLDEENAEVDVYNLDSVWPAMLSEHLVDLRVFMGGMEKLHLPVVIDNYTIRGRLVAMPLFVDTGVMYYRRDLLDKYNLPLPFTWSMLVECANKVVASERTVGNPELWGLVFQGKPYEGLTCCALEWLYANAAGTIVDENGAVTVNNPAAAKALEEVSEWMGTLVPMKALAFAEEESLNMFRSGQAVFMRNWPYAWLYLQEEGSHVRGKVGVMPVPKGTPNGESPGVMGGWGLAVSRYSRNRDVAADLVFYLTGPAGQKKFCLLDNHIPSLLSLFYDPDIRRQVPMAILEFFTASVPRPARYTGTKYDSVSREFFTAVHSILSGRQSPEKGLLQLENALNDLKRDGWK